MLELIEKKRYILCIFPYHSRQTSHFSCVKDSVTHEVLEIIKDDSGQIPKPSHSNVKR